MEQRRVFRHSHHAERALTLPRPAWRGRTHRWAAIATVPLGAWLVATTPAGAPRWACLAFVVGTFAMFAASALNHARRWSPHTTEVMVRVDHSGIYFAIAGTAVAVAVLGLPWNQARIVLWVVGVVCAVAILVEWLPFASPRGLNNAVYLTLGWGSVLALPSLWQHAGVLAVVLLLGGGVLYTVGVVIVSRQWPDPDPEVFGYHEIWHLLVIAATALHAVDVAFVLR